MSHQDYRVSRRSSLDGWDPMTEDFNSRTFNCFGNKYELARECGNEDNDLPSTLYISKIPPNFDKQGLRNIFSLYGRVASVRLVNATINKPAYAFVDFASHTEAQKAILETNNKPPWHLHVNFALRSFHHERFESTRSEYQSSQCPKYEDAAASDEEESYLDYTREELSDSFEEEKMHKLLVTFGENERKVTMVRPLSDRPEFKHAEGFHSAFYDRLELQNGADFNDSSSSHSSGSCKKNKGSKYNQRPAQQTAHTSRKILHELNDAEDHPTFTQAKDFAQYERNETNSSRRSSREGCQDGVKHHEMSVSRPRFVSGRGLPRPHVSSDWHLPKRNIPELSFRHSIGNNYNNNQHQQTQENNPFMPSERHSTFTSLQKTLPHLDEQTNISSRNASRFPPQSNPSQFLPQVNARHFNEHSDVSDVCLPRYKTKPHPKAAASKEKVPQNKLFNKNQMTPYKSKTEANLKSNKEIVQPESVVGQREAENSLEPSKTWTCKPVVNDIKKELVEKTLSTAKLPLGTKVNVYVSHYVDENAVWVQQLNAIEKLKTCIENLNLNKNTLDRNVAIGVGNVCAAKFSKDDEWYRGKIEKVSQDKITIYFVDYGNSEETTRDNLAVLPSKCFSLPAQAIKCKIDNLSSAEVALEKILWIKTLSVNDGVHLINVHDEYDDAVKCEEVAEAKMDLASPPTSCFLDDVQMCEEVNICITLVESENIWGHLLLNGRLDDLVSLITETSNTENWSDDKTKPIKKNDIVLARSLSDNEWYRGIVLEELNNGEKRIFYVDYGNVENVIEVKSAPDKIRGFSSPLVHCRISEVNKSNAIIMSADDKINFMPKTRKDGCVLGDVSLNDISVARATLSPWYQMVPYIKTVLEQKKLDIKESADATKSEEKIITEEVGSYSLEVGPLYNVLLLFVDETSVYVGLMKHFKLFKEFSMKMNSLNGACNESYSPRLGEIVCAKYCEDDKWYRAKVLELLDNKSYKVHFIDYGNKETISPKNIRSYSQDANFPRFAVETSVKSNAQESEEIQRYINKELLMRIVNNQTEPLDVEFFNLEGQPLCTNLANDETSSCKNSESTSGDKDKPNRSCSNSDLKQVSQSQLERPTLENLPKIPLQCNEDYHAFLFCVSDDFLYVCLLDDINPMILMNHQINDYAEDQHCSYEPVVNELICAKYSDDNLWYRAVVKEINDTIKVFFVDYGNSDEVDFAKVRKLPTFAENHCLYARPVLVENFDESRPLLKQHEQTLLNVKIIDSRKGVPLVELRNLEGVNLIENREQSKADTMVDIKISEKEPQILTCIEYDPPLAKNIFEKVVILHINVDENIIYISLFKRYENLCQFIIKMNEYCTKTNNTTPYIPSVKEIVCAKFSLDSSWYRAQVTQVVGSNVHIVFIDFGNSTVESIENIKQLPAEFACPNIFAVSVAVDCDVALFQKYFNRPLNMKVLDHRQSTLLAEFYDLEQNPIFQKTINASITSQQEVQVDGSGETCSDLSNVPNTGGSFFQCSDLKTIMFPLGEIKLTVVSVLSPEIIFCTLIEEENLKAMAELSQEINNYCNEMPDSSYKPRRVEMCLAKYSDGCWYRAANLKESGNNCQVIFIDYGNVEIVSSSDLRPITARFMAEPQMAVQCSLSNLPTDVAWSTEICESLKKLLPLNVIVEAIVLERKEDRYIIEIPSLSQTFYESGITVSADRAQGTDADGSHRI